MKIERFSKYLEAALQKFATLSERERLLIIGSAAVIFSLAATQLIASSISLFETQSRSITLAEEDIRTLPTVLERYTRLRARRDAIETQYRQVAMKEGALSYIEELIKSKLKLVRPNFDIKDPAARPFGGQFEQLPYILKLSTTDIDALVDFLKEIVEGAKPLILSRLELQRRAGSERLEVEMDISSIRLKRGA